MWFSSIFLVVQVLKYSPRGPGAAEPCDIAPWLIQGAPPVMFVGLVHEKPYENPTKPHENPMKPHENPMKTHENPMNPHENPMKPHENPMKTHWKLVNVIFPKR